MGSNACISRRVLGELLKILKDTRFNSSDLPKSPQTLRKIAGKLPLLQMEEVNVDQEIVVRHQKRSKNNPSGRQLRLNVLQFPIFLLWNLRND